VARSKRAADNVAHDVADAVRFRVVADPVIIFGVADAGRFGRKNVLGKIQLSLIQNQMMVTVWQVRSQAVGR